MDLADMDLMFLGPWPLFLMALIVVMIVMTNSGRRPREPKMRDRSCARCGAVHPPFANYCSRCGHELE